MVVCVAARKFGLAPRQKGAVACAVAAVCDDGKEVLSLDASHIHNRQRGRLSQGPSKEKERKKRTDAGVQRVAVISRRSHQISFFFSFFFFFLFNLNLMTNWDESIAKSLSNKNNKTHT